MKKLFSTFAFLLFFLGNSQVDIKKLSVEVSKNSKFVELSNILEKFSNNIVDAKSANVLFKEENLNENEKLRIANALGFNTLEDILKFEEKNLKLLSEIISEFKLNTLSNNDLNELFISSFNLTASNYQTEGRTCEQKFRSCKIGAWGVYGVVMAGCAAAGVTIGVASFWSAGAIGGIVGAMCATAATASLSSMLDDCQDKFDDCKG